MQSDDLIWKLLSVTQTDERKPSFLFSCYSTSCCGYSSSMWVHNYLDKFMVENSIKGYLTKKKFHFCLGKTLSHKLLEAGPIPWEISAVYPLAGIIDGLSRHATGLDSWSYSPQPILCSVSFFPSYCNTNTDHYSQLRSSDSKSKKQSCVHYVEKINTTN